VCSFAALGVSALAAGAYALDGDYGAALGTLAATSVSLIAGGFGSSLAESVLESKALITTDLTGKLLYGATVGGADLAFGYGFSMPICGPTPGCTGSGGTLSQVLPHQNVWGG
jgi:hypothetical protein